MNLHDEVEKIKGEGYSEANAEAKLCQDIVLSILFGCHIDDILVHNMTAGEDESPLLPLCA